MKTSTHNTITAVLTVAVFSLYILTDIIEIAAGQLSSWQVQMTHIAFLLIPFAIMGLYARDHKKGGIAYLIGSFFIAVAFIYYSGTDTAALVSGITDYPELVQKLGFSYSFFSLLYITGAIMVSVIMLLKKIHHPIPAILILFGSIISFIIGAMQLSDSFQIASNMFRNFGFAIIGLFILLDKGTD